MNWNGRRALPLIALLLLLASVGIAAFVYDLVSAPLFDNIELRLNAMLSDFAGTMDNFFTAKVAELQALAQVDALAAMHKESALLSMVKLQENDPDFEVLALSDLNGYAHATSGDAQQIADRDYWRLVVASHEPVIGNPILSRLSARPVIPIAVPVIGKSGALQAVLVGTIRAERLNRLVAGLNQGLNKALLVQRDGRLAYHPQESLVRQELSGLAVPKDPTILSTILAGGAGEIEFTRAGIPWRAYYAPLTTAGWTAVLLIDKQETFAALRVLQQALLIGGFLLALLLLAGGSFLTYHTRYDVRLQDMAAANTRMQSVFRDLNTGVILADATGLITTVNLRAAEITGWTETEAKGLPVDRVISATTFPGRLSELVRACVRGQKAEVWEFDTVDRSGNSWRVWVDASPVSNLDGTVIGAALLILDVTKLRANEAKLNHYDLLAGRTRDIIIVLGQDGSILDANTAAVHAYGYPRVVLIGMDIRQLSEQGSMPETDGAAQPSLDQGVVFETRHRRADGSSFPVEVSSQLARQGEQDVVVNIIHDISERQRAAAEIHQLSWHDRLTGLHNRRYLEEQLAAVGEHDLPLTLVVGDVNGLKLANDAFGHEVGDKLLRQIGEIMRECAGDHLVARWGGDEFVVLVKGAGAEAAQQIMECIWANCRQAPIESIAPSVALGFATRTDIQQSSQEIWRQAEDRMYRNKLSQGRGVRSAFISSLRTTLAERSHETEEHGLRMQRLGLVLGRAVGFSESDLDELQLLALLHDLGKVAIPDRILLKPGALTPEEWETMRQHSEIGFRIAQATPEMLPIANAILAHHERWDGQGYPLGLAGEQIPRLARLIAILDAYDVMTHDRVYQAAISGEAALQEIAAGAGKQFDPELVSVFLQLCAAGHCPMEQ